MGLQLHTTAQGETGATIQTVQQLTDANGHAENMTVDLTEATLGQDGQIIITGEDGQGTNNNINIKEEFITQIKKEEFITQIEKEELMIED